MSSLLEDEMHSPFHVLDMIQPSKRNVVNPPVVIILGM